MIKIALGCVIIMCVSAFLNGCEGMPIKDGGLAVGKDTVATIDDVGVARVDNKF